MKYLIFLFLFFTNIVVGQDATFSVSISTDSLLIGNDVEVRFTLENAQGQTFEAPDFENFTVVSGPNQSSSFSMINGAVTQELSYSYYLNPIEVGTFYIAPASIQVEGELMSTEAVEIIVYPNPDGVVQEIPEKHKEFDLFQRSFPATPNTPPKSKKPKKKRRIYRL